MSLLIDYACSTCQGRFEAWVASPPPASSGCPSCGGAARRSWSPVGLLTSGAGAGRASSAPTAERATCASSPNVPGLCCLSPDAGRMWSARARKDNRSIERELARQEARHAEGKTAPALTHDDARHVRGAVPAQAQGCSA